ncbi:MAG: flavin reductase family protein [Acidimicrobiales bacterium]
MEEPKKLFDLVGEHAGRGYALGTGLVVPRPIGWIGSISADGHANLAPYSFFNMVAHTPVTFVVAPALGARKDTLDNLESTGVFTVNVVTEQTLEAMNASSATLPAEADEFAATGLTALTSDTCAAPRVAEAAANFECRVVQAIPVGTPTESAPGSGMVVIGEADRVLIAGRVLDDDERVDARKLAAIGRHGGSWYSTTADNMLSVERPD